MTHLHTLLYIGRGSADSSPKERENTYGIYCIYTWGEHKSPLLRVYVYTELLLLLLSYLAWSVAKAMLSLSLLVYNYIHALARRISIRIVASGRPSGSMALAISPFFIFICCWWCACYLQLSLYISLHILNSSLLYSALRSQKFKLIISRI